MSKTTSLRRTDLNICTKITLGDRLNCNLRSMRPTFKPFNLKSRKRGLTRSVSRPTEQSTPQWVVHKQHQFIYLMNLKIKFIIIKKNLVIWLFTNNTKRRIRNRRISLSKSTEMKVWPFNRRPSDLTAQLDLLPLAPPWRILPRKTRTLIYTARETTISAKLRKAASCPLDLSELL